MNGLTDLQMLMRPDLWPYYPSLPMRKVEGESTIYGVVVTLWPRTVLIVPEGKWKEVDLNTCERKEYPSIKSIVADGWVVD